MTIIVSVQHNGGFLLDIILLNQCYYVPSGNPLQPMIPSKLFDIFPPNWGMLRRSKYVQVSL